MKELKAMIRNGFFGKCGIVVPPLAHRKHVQTARFCDGWTIKKMLSALRSEQASLNGTHRCSDLKNRYCLIFFHMLCLNSNILQTSIYTAKQRNSSKLELQSFLFKLYMIRCFDRFCPIDKIHC